MQELFSVQGKVALVTGGSRGIGEMIARGFVEHGVRTYISARKAQACEELAAELSAHGTCIALPADVARLDEVRRLAAELAGREPVLDILVNNAGAAWGAPIDEFPEDGWDKVMDLNVKSPFFLTQALLPLLRRAARAESPARIINIGSIDGLTVPGLHDTYSYPASKAALHHLTRVLAARLARDHINVNAVAPGPFPSKMMAATLAEHGDRVRAGVPRGRIGTPEDMAGVAIYLASRAGDYVTGAVIPVDGGASTCR